MLAELHLMWAKPEKNQVRSMLHHTHTTLTVDEVEAPLTQSHSAVRHGLLGILAHLPSLRVERACRTAAILAAMTCERALKACYYISPMKS